MCPSVSLLSCLDINLNALTFRTASSYVEANASKPDMLSHFGLGGFYHEDILINVRTFDTQAIIFYVYDYLNNFVQLHIENGSRVVFTFNSGNTIYDVRTEVQGKHALVFSSTATEQMI